MDTGCIKGKSDELQGFFYFFFTIAGLEQVAQKCYDSPSLELLKIQLKHKLQI